MRVFENADYPFLQWRTRAYVVSGLLLLAGIAAMVVSTVRTGTWLNYGVDFAGGTLVQIDFNRPTTVEQIRAASPGWEISRFGTEEEFIIRMPTFNQEAGADAAQAVRATLGERFPAGSFEVVRTEAVGPKVGAELQQRALLAILFSLALTLVYLAFRFEWRFGVAAVIATTHDILVTLGFLALLRNEISVGTVAAFLTIVGYSLNDTIIVFDRIRENLRLPGGPRDYMTVLNRSINQTLPRTVLTSGTTLVTLLSLFLFGGAIIRDFALVLILGVVIGTFSSIFVAAPALFELHRRAAPAGPPRSRAAAASAPARVKTTV